MTPTFDSPANEMNTLYKHFNKTVLTILLDLADSATPLTNESVSTLATSIGRTPAFVQKLYVATQTLTEMPALKEKLLESGEFDLDRLASLGGQIAHFDHLEPREMETILLTLLDTEESCPSPSRLSKAIKEGDYKKSQRKAVAVRKRESHPPTARAVEITQGSNHSTITVRCTNEQAALAKRLIEERAEKDKCSSIEALLTILMGGKQPRIQITAIELPKGKSYVEGTGWVDTSELATMSPHLQNRKIIDQETMTEFCEIVIGIMSSS